MAVGPQARRTREQAGTDGKTLWDEITLEAETGESG